MLCAVTPYKNELEGNCDFSSNNNVWTKFYDFFGDHFKFCWVIFIMTDRLEFRWGFLAAILNWNFSHQISNLKFQRSEVPIELLYF